MNKLVVLISLAILTLLVVFASAQSAVAYVRSSSPGPTFGGNSWDSAFQIIPSRTGAGTSIDGSTIRIGKAGCVAGTTHEARQAAKGALVDIQDSILSASFPGLIEPLSMPTRSLGGGSWFFNPNTGGGLEATKAWRLVEQPDKTYVWELRDVEGMNNIGLLVKIQGRVVKRLADGFYLDDGSGRDDGDRAVPGVRVLVPAGVTIPEEQSYVVVTGISSCYRDEEAVKRLLRVRMLEDIQQIVVSD